MDSSYDDVSRFSQEYRDVTERKTMTVPEAGEVYFGLSKNSSYEAAKRGDIPTVRVGRLLRVPVLAMEKKLEAACRKPDA